MAKATLVGQEIDDGFKLIQELKSKNFDITAAFWLKRDEDSSWYLYIASKDVDDRTKPPAYQTVREAMRALGDDLWIDPFQIKVISANDPMARDLVATQERYPRAVTSHYGGTRLGDAWIEEAYVYPPILAS
jgi:hypothetical protein